MKFTEQKWILCILDLKGLTILDDKVNWIGLFLINTISHLKTQASKKLETSSVK